MSRVYNAAQQRTHARRAPRTHEYFFSTSMQHLHRCIRCAHRFTRCKACLNTSDTPSVISLFNSISLISCWFDYLISGPGVVGASCVVDHGIDFFEESNLNILQLSARAVYSEFLRRVDSAGPHSREVHLPRLERSKRKVIPSVGVWHYGVGHHSIRLDSQRAKCRGGWHTYQCPLLSGNKALDIRHAVPPHRHVVHLYQQITWVHLGRKARSCHDGGQPKGARTQKTHMDTHAAGIIDLVHELATAQDRLELGVLPLQRLWSGPALLQPPAHNAHPVCACAMEGHIPAAGSRQRCLLRAPAAARLPGCGS